MTETPNGHDNYCLHTRRPRQNGSSRASWHSTPLTSHDDAVHAWPALPTRHSHNGFTIGALFDTEYNTTVSASRLVRVSSGEISSNLYCFRSADVSAQFIKVLAYNCVTNQQLPISNYNEPGQMTPGTYLLKLLGGACCCT